MGYTSGLGYRASKKVWNGNLLEKHHGRPRRMWENNIKMGLMDMDYEDGWWTH